MSDPTLLQSANAVVGLICFPVGVLWAIFGKERDLRLNGVQIPAGWQAFFRLAAPVLFMMLISVANTAAVRYPTKES